MVAIFKNVACFRWYQNDPEITNYLLKKKGTENKARIEPYQIPQTAPVKKDKKQLMVEAIG